MRQSAAKVKENSFLDKVQRLSHDREYRPIVIGSGSARVPDKN